MCIFFFDTLSKIQLHFLFHYFFLLFYPLFSGTPFSCRNTPRVAR
jgi:hypothetical protein